MRRAWAFVRRQFPVLVIAGALAWSTGEILTYRTEETPPGTIALRLCHWQLEAGVRTGLEEMAAEYSRLHPNVRIIQEPVPETAYGPWITTQLLGGDPPDMVSTGKGLPYATWVSFYTRYFLTISREVNQPNPYNAGTELEGQPFRTTYKDGMVVGYQPELQEYNKVPLSQFGLRIFYNKDLLRRLTGRTEPPTEYRDFLACCAQIQSQRDETGMAYVPIAGSKFHFEIWEYFLFDPITYPAYREVDLNRDGVVGNDELYATIRTGRVSFTTPAFAARFKMVREVTQYFQTGYTGLTRDDAVFLFAQQRAVFIITGTWDVLSLVEQARGAFDVGLMRAPMPRTDDPEYGPLVEGAPYEIPFTSFSFAITRACKHPEVALDFLLFLASQKGNERFNRTIGWIPAIQGTQSSPVLSEYQPNMDGMFPVLTQATVNLEGETYIKWLQLYSLYQVNQISFEDFVREFEPFYKERGYRDFQEVQNNKTRGLIIDAAFVAGMRSRAMAATGIEEQSLWVRYRALVAGRLVGMLMYRNLLSSVADHNRGLTPGAPYEYLPGVKEKVRARVLRELREGPGVPAATQAVAGAAG